MSNRKIKVMGWSGAQPGAVLDIEDSKEMTFHYIFSIDELIGYDYMRTELENWNPEMVEYKGSEDVIVYQSIPNISKLIDSWNAMGINKIPAPVNINPLSPEFNLGWKQLNQEIKIGIVILLTHGEYDDDNMYIPEKSGASDNRLYKGDVEKGYKSVQRRR